MQQTLVVGDTLVFDTSLPDYPASAGWTLTYRLIPRTSGTAIEIPSTANGDAHAVSVSATVTALWAAGEYSWAGYATKAGERDTVESGTITLLPDPGVAAAYDGRSQARKAVDDLHAAYASYLSSNGLVQEYTIAGRSTTFRKTSEILEALSYWELKLQAEEAAAGAAAGQPSKRRTYIRLGHA